MSVTLRVENIAASYPIVVAILPLMAYSLNLNTT
jgi:hypothetical protein